MITFYYEIGGSPTRFKPFVDLYKQALERFGFEPQPIAVHSPGHVAETVEPPTGR